MNKFLAIVLLAAAGAASAKTPVPVPPSPVTQSQSMEQEQNQSQGQSQSASAQAGATASSGGNTQQVVITQPRQAPAVLAAQTNTTAKCARAVGASVAVAGFGIGGSMAVRDKDCRLAEAAEYELAQGNKGASIALRCQVSFYKVTFGDTCIAILNEVTVERPSLSREQVREALSGGK